MDWISISEACQLLGISRPTLNVYRRKYQFSEARLRGRIHLSKTELIKKVILPEGKVLQGHSLTVLSDSNIDQIQPLPGVYDLRGLKGIDAYGVMALLCSIKAYLKQDAANTVHLLVVDTFFCSYLASIGFFTEVERAHSDRIFFDRTVIQKRPQTRTAVIVPLHLIGYRGAEKKILDELYDPLLKQGFSEDCCGHIGWIVGELCDNAHTHSEGPCYLIVEGLHTESTATRFLSIAIGDTGIGIPASLQKNPKYTQIEARRLLPLAFLSEVSRMEVEPKRGKGLNDIITIAKGNESWLRVESGNLAIRFNFVEGANQTEFVNPIVRASGTRFCLVLIDGKFTKVPRAEVNLLMQNFLETL